MSLRILFADDSMTAQNMGKKILSEAGYDVVAVSNGAAAVKKIAEQKPDIIILDVYMPGYSGLEVCEKVRGSLDTLKTPVLLTVGKMEPYKPEDANRVKADGVIIKPFEATDLLAIVKKFEERIGSAPPPPMVAQAAAPEPEAVEEAVVMPAETAVDHHTSHGRPNSQPMVEVPDHMASSAAFGDLLGGEPSNSTSHFAVNSPSATFETSVIVPAPPVLTADREVAIPAFEEAQPDPVVAAMRASVETLPAPEPVPDLLATPVEAIPEPVIEATPEPAISPAPVADAPHPQFIPVFNEPAPVPEPEYSFMPTSTPAAADIDIPREPALQETAEETTRSTKVDHVEPGLMSTIGQQVEEFPAGTEAPVPEAFQVESTSAEETVPQVSNPASAPVVEAATEVTDTDFEARVAAAMSAYSQVVHPETAHAAEHKPSPVVAEPGPVAAPPVPEINADEPPTERAFAAAAPIPSFEYQPPVQAVTSVPFASAPAEIAYEHATPVVEAPVSPVSNSMNVDHASVASSVEAAIPEAAAAVAVDAGMEHHHTIAQAVHRVMERLKPELVEEIMKELKTKK